MKRGGSLQRRTPLRTVTPGLKRSRLKASQPGQTRRLRVPSVSTRTAAYNSEFAAIRPMILRRAGGRCEARCSPDCLMVASDVHHRKPRAQLGRNEESNLLAVDMVCHRWIESHRTEAYRRGLLVKSWQDPAEVPILTA